MKWLLALLLVASAELTLKLKAKWPAPTQLSLLQETSEFLWAYDPPLFWVYLSRFDTSAAPSLASLNLSEGESKLISSSLHTREFAPRLEVFSKLAEEHRSTLSCPEFFYLPSTGLSSCEFPEDVDPPQRNPAEDIFPFDHLSSVPAVNATYIVHYRNITNPGSRYAVDTAKSKGFVYVVRHIDLRNHSESDTLAGYGAQLLIKNMEYKPVENPERQNVVNGFDFAVLKNRFPEEKEKLEELHAYLERRYDWNRPLKNWEMKGKSHSELSIKTAQALANILKSTHNLTEAYDFLRSFPDHSISTATLPMTAEFKAEVETNARLLTYVRGRPILTTELNVFDISHILRTDYLTYHSLLDLGLSPESASRILWSGNQQLHTETKSQSGVLKTGPETGRVYLNDLEEDKKYSEWSSDIEDMFMGGPGGVVGINVYNLVLVGDVTTEEFWRVMKALALMYQSNWPLHIGVILTNPANLGLNSLLLSMLRALRKEDESLPMLFLSDLNETLTEESLMQAFGEICYKHCEVSKEQESVTAKRAVEFCRVTGVCEAQVLLNGRLLDKAAEGRFDRVLYSELNQERQLLGFLLYNRALKSPIERFFEDGKHSKVIERLNPCITVSDSDELKIAVVEIDAEGFVLQTDSSQVKKMTVTLGVEIEKVELLKLAVVLLREKADTPVRFRVMFRTPKSGDMSYVIFLAHLIAVGDLKSLENALESPHLAMENPENDHVLANLKSQQRVFEEVSMDSFVLVRGRLIDAHCFRDYRDFELLLKTELGRVNIPEDSLEFVTDIDNVSAERVSEVLDRAGEALIRAVNRLPAFHKYREFPIPTIPAKHTSIDLTTDSPIQVITLLNPLKPESQRLLSILSWLQDLGASVRLILNPQLLYSEGEQPLQRWYGYVAGKRMGDELKMKLTEAVMVTLSLDTPEKWVVYSKQTELDLDNLRSAEDVEVVYELSGLVVDGSCAQLLYGYPTEPPAGLQLVLSNSTHPFVADTSVMQNVGYYQFQASPGVYKIRLKEGRSKELFELFGEERIVLDGLTPELQNMQVTKKEGMEEEELLGEEAECVEIGDTIHVFTLASGHLYERLLRIMILSVLSHTSSKVKFWILGNFLSPKFRASMPSLALKLDFQYEFVTYAWPFWLYPQKEKQRIIWAYKILFLDVLFPLSVPKIIYIDADQVVRSDIKELWEMDLQGAPYAYTPFCDSNKDTEGFRFWKSGFWKKHLSGLPYHISALYVIDLNKFRSTGAGDTLRYLYSNMARDPNSLANLDQDLPNYAQQQVPIHSLPQEWLWCATWCDIESLKTAKTIDLCNNPLTKEPKIQVAKRLIPEWSHYDQLLQDFDKSLLSSTPFEFIREPIPPLRDDL